MRPHADDDTAHSVRSDSRKSESSPNPPLDVPAVGPSQQLAANPAWSHGDTTTTGHGKRTSADDTGDLCSGRLRSRRHRQGGCRAQVRTGRPDEGDMWTPSVPGLPDLPAWAALPGMYCGTPRGGRARSAVASARPPRLADSITVSPLGLGADWRASGDRASGDKAGCHDEEVDDEQARQAAEPRRQGRTATTR